MRRNALQRCSKNQYTAPAHAHNKMPPTQTICSADGRMEGLINHDGRLSAVPTMNNFVLLFIFRVSGVLRARL